MHLSQDIKPISYLKSNTLWQDENILLAPSKSMV